jgi:hypothetical protein
LDAGKKGEFEVVTKILDDNEHKALEIVMMEDDHL